MANPIKALKAVKKIKPQGVKGRGTKSTSIKEPKSAVKVKPAAKQKSNKPNQAKVYNKMNSSRNRIRGGVEVLTPGDAADRALAKVQDGRKVKIAQKKLDKARMNKATTPKNEKDFHPWTYAIKINSNPKRGK